MNESEFESTDYLNNTVEEREKKAEELDIAKTISYNEIQSQFEEIASKSIYPMCVDLELECLQQEIYSLSVHEDLLNNKGIKQLYSLMNPLLMICGVSGSGKSTLEMNLLNFDKNLFNKLPQVTTREKRNEEDNYYFIDKSTYKYLKKSLIAKLENFNGNSYGTIPVFKSGAFNTVVVSADAIRDILKLIETEDEFYCTPYLVMLDIDDNDLPSENRRNGRNNNFLDKERLELQKVIVQNIKKFRHFTYFKIKKDGSNDNKLKYVHVRDLFTFSANSGYMENCYE